MTADDFKSWRKSLGLTQPEAGALLDLSTRTISEYETGGTIHRTVEFACKWISLQAKPKTVMTVNLEDLST